MSASAGNQEMVVISQAEYEELVSAAEKFWALQGAGVDNWEGYAYAMQSLNES